MESPRTLSAYPLRLMGTGQESQFSAECMSMFAVESHQAPACTQDISGTFPIDSLTFETFVASRITWTCCSFFLVPTPYSSHSRRTPSHAQSATMLSGSAIDSAFSHLLMACVVLWTPCFCSALWTSTPRPRVRTPASFRASCKRALKAVRREFLSTMS